MRLRHWRYIPASNQGSQHLSRACRSSSTESLDFCDQNGPAVMHLSTRHAQRCAQNVPFLANRTVPPHWRRSDQCNERLARRSSSQSMQTGSANVPEDYLRRMIRLFWKAITGPLTGHDEVLGWPSTSLAQNMDMVTACRRFADITITSPA
jgi:hypothetical protein